MEIPTLERATDIAFSLLRDNAALSRYTARLSVLLVGSVATGHADEGSDVDMCFVAPPSIWHELKADLARAGFKSGRMPNEMTAGALKVDWFVASLSDTDAKLEAGEDYALYEIQHFIALQDPDGQYQRLAARYQSLDPQLIAVRVERYLVQVTAGAEYLGVLLQRGDPLECATQALGLAIGAISLCLWLDGRAPGSKRMMEMAEQCSPSECIMPPVRALLQALGGFLAGTAAASTAGCQLMRAAGILVASCERARLRSRPGRLRVATTWIWRGGAMMQTDTLDGAAEVALSMLRDHPVLSRYGASLSVLVAASYATGFDADSSESDACFLAAPAIWEELAVELERSGFTTGGNPYDVKKDGLTVHCFALPLSRHIDALEHDEDAAVYCLCHGRTVHDGNGQWRAVQESHSVPAEGFAASRVARYRTLMAEWLPRWETQISRDRPLPHAFGATNIVHVALSLCCWLDGHAPRGPGSLMEQAARCSEGREIVPAARTLLRELGRFLSGDRCEPPALSALVGAGRALAGACERAVARLAFGEPGSGSSLILPDLRGHP